MSDKLSISTQSGTMVEWRCCTFAELSLHELYIVMQLRQRVFVVEQSSIYLDADGYDTQAWHLLGWRTASDHSQELVAYSRIFPAGAKMAEASFGRVAVDSTSRRRGIGRVLVAKTVQQCEHLSHGSAIRIEAQLYLERFYEEFGFHRVSQPYEEDGIIGITMLRPV